MTHQLKSRDIIALGFMTFALFVGAGNIIFPPMVGLQAGEHVWIVIRYEGPVGGPGMREMLTEVHRNGNA